MAPANGGRTLKRRLRSIVHDAAEALSRRESFAPVPHPYERTKVLFVSGPPRSGTTALRNSIAAHRCVYSTNRESNVVNDVLCAALRNCTLPDRKGNMVVSQHQYDGVFRRALLQLLWPQAWDRPGAPRALSTYTHLEPHSAEYLAKVFPRARIVYIVRNGIETVASAAAFESFSLLPFEVLCRRWAMALKMAQWGEGRDNFNLVRHEHLRDAARAESTVRAMLQWAELGYDEQCLDVLRSTRYHPTHMAGESPDDAQNLNRRAQRWRHWSPQQRETFVEICRPAMEHFGYDIPWTDGATTEAA